MPTSRQAIIWTDDGKFTDVYMRQLINLNISIM